MRVNLQAVCFKKIKQIKARAVISFALTLLLCFTLVFAMVINRSRVEMLTMEQMIIEKSMKVKEVISKLLYKTEILSSAVMQNNGEIKDFEMLAITIVDDPAIFNILVAPDGVVSDVYPLKGNEAVIGLDFFSKGDGNNEAMLAKETGQLVMGGPFESVQGGEVLVGRLPVLISEPDGTKRFWGLVSVTLKYPQALDGAGLGELKAQGFAYELWRISPDNNERQIISNSGHSYNKNTNYIEKVINISNAEWYFRVLPVRAWYEFPETWASVIISVCVSLLVAAVVQNNQELMTLKGRLEKLSNTDSLTGIHNRRYFMDTAPRQMDRTVRTGGESYIIILDLDGFKSINDTYGHQSGDMVLNEVAARISKTLRSYDLFARYGGEEFIVFVSDINKESVTQLAERIRCDISKDSFKVIGNSITVTASLGIAPAAPENELEAAIALADTALYRAKSEGRDRLVFTEN